MKKILLISNYVFHYRINIYNHFYNELYKLGYELHVLSDEYQDGGDGFKFIKHEREFTKVGYIKAIRQISPDVVINFLHLKDRLIFTLTIYCRLSGIPMIYWNHGVNLSKARNNLFNIAYKLIHILSSAIIIYTPNELKYVSKRNHKKVFIAFNTLCFEGIEKDNILDKCAVRRKYDVKESKTVVFISRILPYKQLDVLLNGFSDRKDIAVVVVGAGINTLQLQKIDASPNYYYLGPKYGKEVDEIYNMGDVYCTPGHIGLGIVQAFFWGMPVVVLNCRHAPEIYYLKDGCNGYIVGSEKELKETILFLLSNEDTYKRLSQNAVETVKYEASISRMFGGFLDAISYCSSKV